MTTESAAPSLETLAEITGGKVADMGDRVIVGYGRIGYLTIRPSTVWDANRNDVPAAEITGRLSAGNGGHHATLRAKLTAAGIRPR